MWTNDERDYRLRIMEINHCRSVFQERYIYADGDWIRGYTWYFTCPFCEDKINITRPSSGGRPTYHYGIVVGHLNKHIEEYFERRKRLHPDGRIDYYYRCRICGLEYTDRIYVVFHIVIRHYDQINDINDTWLAIDTQQITDVVFRRVAYAINPKESPIGVRGFWWRGSRIIRQIICKITAKQNDYAEYINLNLGYEAIKSLLNGIGSGIRKIFRDFDNNDERSKFILDSLRKKRKLYIRITEARNHDNMVICFVDRCWVE